MILELRITLIHRCVLLKVSSATVKASNIKSFQCRLSQNIRRGGFWPLTWAFIKPIFNDNSRLGYSKSTIIYKLRALSRSLIVDYIVVHISYIYSIIYFETTNLFNSTASRWLRVESISLNFDLASRQVSKVLTLSSNMLYLLIIIFTPDSVINTRIRTIIHSVLLGRFALPMFNGFTVTSANMLAFFLI